MHACTAFFCLFLIPVTRLSAWGQSFRTVPRTTKRLTAIEAFLLLLVLAFLPATQAWAQTYPIIDTFSGSGELSSNWTNTTATAETYVAAAQVGGSAVPSVSGQQSLVTYTGAAFHNDQYAQVRFVTHSSAGGSTGPCVRMDAAGNGVCYLVDYGVIFLLIGGGGSHGIVSGCPIPASGEIVQLLVQGTTYTCTDVTTGVSASGTDETYWAGSPGMLLDQRNSIVYALAQFQADCLPSCSAFSGPSTLSLGSFPTTAVNPGFDNTATLYLPGGSTVDNGSTATYNVVSYSPWHSSLGSSSWVSYDPNTGLYGGVTPPDGDYFYTTTFTVGRM
jgi:hypothetical protein